MLCDVMRKTYLDRQKIFPKHHLPTQNVSSLIAVGCWLLIVGSCLLHVLLLLCLFFVCLVCFACFACLVCLVCLVSCVCCVCCVCFVLACVACFVCLLFGGRFQSYIPRYPISSGTAVPWISCTSSRNRCAAARVMPSFLGNGGSGEVPLAVSSKLTLSKTNNSSQKLGRASEGNLIF